MPNFVFFMYQLEAAVDKNSSEWDAFLPMNRKASLSSVSYGTYFLAVRDFLEKQFPQADSISIRIQKHGEFYHPARVNVLINGKSSCFVVNAAVSDIGKHCIQREYDLLQQLHALVSPSYIPQVFAIGTSVQDNLEIPMFLGEWFEDYHEFHLSRQTNGKIGIQVWDTENGYYFLSEDQSVSLYYQMAKILTSYYNPATFEQIFSWHHAAGDFIVKRNNDNILSRKLITVRAYLSPIEAEDADAETGLEALLAFIINLSIRMRLDRYDGIGEMAWAEDMSVDATVQGFGDALTVKEFGKYLSLWTEQELADMTNAVVASYNPSSHETALIEKHLPSHISKLYKALSYILN